MKHLIYAAMLIASLVVCSGCETFKGMGKDIQKAGDAIEEAAN
ncbi:MAG: entericidin A/B family lipoprotein [Gammaproteobacteria bacterium]|jgi:predicted small secreted protein